MTNGVGPDIVFECAGSVPISRQSVLLVRKAGTVVVEAICFDPVQLVFNGIVLKGLTIKRSQCFSPGEFSRALNLVGEGEVDIAPLVTHKFGVDNISGIPCCPVPKQRVRAICSCLLSFGPRAVWRPIGNEREDNQPSWGRPERQ